MSPPCTLRTKILPTIRTQNDEGDALSPSELQQSAHQLWDLPVRLIHWLILLLLPASWWTAEEGYQEVHQWLGLTLLVAVLTRLDSLSHTLFWVRGGEVSSVELMRLETSFVMRRGDDGELRVYSKAITYYLLFITGIV